MENIELINFEIEPFTSIINSEEFYFKKGKNAVNRWLDYSIDDNDKITFHNILKDYNTFKSIKSGDKFFELKELFFEIISYCDLHASDKEKYNKYEDKRVLAKAGVRMSPWVNHLYNYKYHPDKTNITVKNALDVLKDPINNINSVSVTHRQLISKFYLNTAYDPLTFVESLKVKFSQLPLIPKVTENTTVLIASVLYNQKPQWMKENNNFEGFTNTFEKYLKDQSLPFQIVKRDKDWFWIADLDGNFGTEDIHYELILEKGKISIDLHFEQSKKTAKEYQSLIGSLPEFLEWKNWGNWGNCISHKNKVTLGEVDSVENAISYLNELYDYTVEFYKKEKQVMKKRIELLKYKKQIILQGPPGTGKTKLANEIADEIIKNNIIENKSLAMKSLKKDFIKSKLFVGQKIEGKNNKEFEIVGLEKNIVLFKSETSKAWRPSYNKIIESFNNNLWELKNRTGGFKPYEDVIAKYFYENYFDTIDSQEENIFREQDFINLIQFHPSYTYEDFVRGIVSKPNENGEGIIYESENKILAKIAETAADDPENNYVLIIDEINRANLSSVLGELIYALEYRGEEVESMYAVDNDNKLILPPNLYIIGTMNTADRSVGHIDYAIRRRFAFVDVLPEKLAETSEIYFNSKGYEDVEKLFINNEENRESNEFVSKEFEVKDVQIGHSYFIAKKEDAKDEVQRDEIFRMKMDYEVKPILREYLRDGIFNSDKKIGELSIKEYIDRL